MESGFWSDEAHVFLHKNRLLEDSLNTLDHYLIITEDELKEYRIWNQIYDLSSLRSELKNHGFTIEGIYADARGTPFYQDSETLCVLARLI